METKGIHRGMFKVTSNQNSITYSPSESLSDRIRSVKKFPTIVEQHLNVDPLSWVQQQNESTKLVWGDRGSEQLTVGLGSAVHVISDGFEPPSEVIDRCRELLRDLPDLRLYGGFAFRPDQEERESAWNVFGPASFWLPRATLNNNRLRIVVRSLNDRTAAIQFADRLKFDVVEPSSKCLTDCVAREDLPGREQWERCIEAANTMFRDEVLEKIVLSRRVDLDFVASIDPLQLMRQLRDVTPACYHFCFQTSRNVAFLGATPERLFFRRNQQFVSEVVAGTRPRGTSTAEDAKLGEDLLASAKDQLEHDIVRKSIRQRLHTCVNRLEVDAHATLLKLANKQHLFSRVSGELKTHIDDGDLLYRLHPTPAVGGYPKENALDEIQRLEPFDRGWFAAPVGWVSDDAAEFAVAIRSGLVQNRRLSLYSGAGIVPGSDALAEWDEVEHKISDFLQLVRLAKPPVPTLGS